MILSLMEVCIYLKGNRITEGGRSKFRVERELKNWRELHRTGTT